MYPDPQSPRRPPVRTRRRRRQKRAPRFLYALNFLLLLFAAVHIVRGVLSQKQTDPAFITKAGAFCQSADTTAPVIHGVTDLLLYAGDPVSYRGGVTVTDDQDAAPVLEIDNSGVDLTHPGSYFVTYRATDAAGNQSTATATVTVLPKQPGFVDVETIYAAADSELSGILTPEMTQLQQPVAIYNWVKANFHYGGHSTRSHYLQAAYEMLTTRTGDCYGYFAVSKLLLDRLNIPNIDVEKVRKSPQDSEHFWSMVSTDGGKTYYHFDTTPRIGGGEFCMVTDAFLDAYSASHNNSHSRDKTRYPATPEE